MRQLEALREGAQRFSLGTGSGGATLRSSPGLVCHLSPDTIAFHSIPVDISRLHDTGDRINKKMIGRVTERGFFLVFGGKGREGLVERLVSLGNSRDGLEVLEISSDLGVGSQVVLDNGEVMQRHAEEEIGERQSGAQGVVGRGLEEVRLNEGEALCQAISGLGNGLLAEGSVHQRGEGLMENESKGVLSDIGPKDLDSLIDFGAGGELGGIDWVSLILVLGGSIASDGVGLDELEVSIDESRDLCLGRDLEEAGNLLLALEQIHRDKVHGGLASIQ